MIILSLLTLVSVTCVSAATYNIDQINSSVEPMKYNKYIQSVINNASDGDVIKFTGDYYTHIHLSINKKLTITCNPGTKVSSCPQENPTGSDNRAVFSIISGGSGTCIENFWMYGGASNGYGVNINGADHVTISNCKIQQTQTGINVLNSDYALISGNDISSSSEHGISVKSNTSNMQIINNNIHDNTGNGISFLLSCVDSSVLNNIVRENNGHGINIDTIPYNLLIKNNFVYMNGGCGMVYNSNMGTSISESELASRSKVIGNYVANNAQNGGTNRDLVRWVTPGGSTRWGFPNEQTCFGVYNVRNATLCPGTRLPTTSRDVAILGNISEVSQGVYRVVFVITGTNNIASELGGFPVTFILNKNNLNSPFSESGDYIKTADVANGVATVNFYNGPYNTSGNTVFVSAPQKTTSHVMYSVYNVSDNNIPSLLVTSSVNKKTVTKGKSVVYTVSVRNIGNTVLRNVRVSNILAKAYFKSSANPTRGTYKDGVWTIGALNPGEVLTLKVSATALKTGAPSTTAQVSADGVKTKYSDNIKVAINKGNEESENSDSSNIGMLNTGLPVGGLIFSILSILGLVFIPKRKKI